MTEQKIGGFRGRNRRQIVKVCLRVPTASPCPSKFYHCAYGDGASDGQNGFHTHSAHQTDRHYVTINKM